MDFVLIEAIVVLAVGFALAAILCFFYRRLKSRAEETPYQIDEIILEAVGPPLIVTILIITIYISAGLFVIPEKYQWILSSSYLDVVYIIIGSWVVASFLKDILAVYEKRKAIEREDRSGDKLIHFLTLSIRYIVWAIGFLLILRTLHIDITPILAGAGLASIVLGLAAQDILANFFGGFMIAADQPFRTGDRILIEGYLGDVVSIGPRSTRIKTLDFQIVTIPNKILTENILTNYAEPDIKLKVRIPIGVAYGTDVTRVKGILMEIAREGIKEGIIIPYPAPSVYFLEFADSSLNFMLLVWTDDYSMAWDVQDYINTRIDVVFKKEGIEIPFPQRVVHLEK
ncbi:MAG: mechanosensitive ion channel family protein [Methanospirillaceae archaeon]|nr:mechanosensitive ion channel family protein [Methanospirillaceae archaeon]